MVGVGSGAFAEYLTMPAAGVLPVPAGWTAAESLGTSLAVTRPFTGRIVVFGAASGDATLSTDELVFNHQVHVIGLHIGKLAVAAPDFYELLMKELRELIRAGVYQPGRPTMHALAEGPALLQSLETRQTTGKHALNPTT